MTVAEQKFSMDVKALVVAGISCAGIALVPPTILSTGAVQITGGMYAAWDEASLLERYVEIRDRLPEMLLPMGSGSRYRLENPAFSLASGGREFREQPATSKSPSELIAEIRAALALQIKELSEIVGVERPTIYAWLKGVAEPHKQNYSRLRRIHHIALAWRRLSQQPAGSLMREIDEGGLSLIEHMKKDPIPEETILSRFRAVASGARAASLDRPSVREAARSRGIDLSRVSDQTETIDVLTGKRASLE